MIGTLNTDAMSYDLQVMIPPITKSVFFYTKVKVAKCEFSGTNKFLYKTREHVPLWWRRKTCLHTGGIFVKQQFGFITKLVENKFSSLKRNFSSFSQFLLNFMNQLFSLVKAYIS